MHADTRKYNKAQAAGDRAICQLLAAEIDRALPEADNKVRHEIDTTKLRRWLEEARDVQWDSKNLIRRKGRLQRVKPIAARRRPMPK